MPTPRESLTRPYGLRIPALPVAISAPRFMSSIKANSSPNAAVVWCHPDGLRTLSVNRDLTSNPLTGVKSKTGVLKIVSRGCIRQSILRSNRDRAEGFPCGMVNQYSKTKYVHLHNHGNNVSIRAAWRRRTRCLTKPVLLFLHSRKRTGRVQLRDGLWYPMMIP